MEGKLVKRSNSRFDLYTIEDINQINTIASSFDNPKGKLSIKNCQVIESGYDLDELAEKNTSDCDASGCYPEDVFKKGFQKALEILGDKKFSISEVVELCKILMSNPFEKCGKTYQELIDNYIQSLQQTEWDVEIELICPHPSDTYVCGMQYGCDGDGCNHPEQIPYLDSDGCLILKRI
jgi:hypothetical protein